MNKEEFETMVRKCAQVCLNQQSGHGKRKGGSDTGDAARRGCAAAIMDLLRTDASFGTQQN